MKTGWIIAMVLVGCGAEQRQTESASGHAVITHKSAVSRDARDGRERGDTSIVIDKEIASRCALPTAHFDFDSDHVGYTESPSLDALAACFVTGPMQGHAMKLVGHADPRGEIQYNFALGQRRAGNVAGYLTKKGMADSSIETTSLGESEAEGTDRDSWARDRKVEVLLSH